MQGKISLSLLKKTLINRFYPFLHIVKGAVPLPNVHNSSGVQQQGVLYKEGRAAQRLSHYLIF